VSAYVPTDWVDGTTPLDEAHLDKIEQGIADATDLALALDALPKLPPLEEGEWLKVEGGALVWSPLPTGGGGGLDWEGNWVGSTPYVKGDVVTKDGVVYGAVNDSTGETPPPAPGVGQAPLVIGIGTSLPASPFDGQEYILTDSLTVPTYSWRFRYVASITDAYKWVFIGGTDSQGFEATLVSYASAAFTGLGPGASCPRPGIYDAEHRCVIATGSAQDFFWKFATSGSVAIAGAREHHQTTQSGNQWWVVTYRERLTITTPNPSAVHILFRNGGAGNSNKDRQTALRPVRIA